MEYFYINGKAVVAVCWTSWVAFITWLIGGFDLLIISLVVLMVLDYISGVLAGYREGNLNSKKAYDGIHKKVMVLLLIAVGNIVSLLFNEPAIRNVVAMFYCSIEVLSIIENAGKLGIPIPDRLRKALEQCRDAEKK